MKLYTAKEVAEILHYDVNTVYIKIRSGVFKANKIGKHYLMTEEELERIVKGE